MFCKNCAKKISDEAESCPFCGQPFKKVYESKPKSKWVAFWLCFCLGGIGIHRYYSGKIASGVLFSLFFWTYIPVIISIVDLIVIGVKSQEDYQEWVDRK